MKHSEGQILFLISRLQIQNKSVDFSEVLDVYVA